MHACSRQRPLLLQEVSPIQGVCTFYGACRVKRNDYMHQVERGDLSCSNDSLDKSSKVKFLENELIVFGCIIDSFISISTLSRGEGGYYIKRAEKCPIFCVHFLTCESIQKWNRILGTNSIFIVHSLCRVDAGVASPRAPARSTSPRSFSSWEGTRRSIY